MKKLISFLALVTLVSSYCLSADDSDKKQQRLIMKANRFYENFAYNKAVKKHQRLIMKADRLYDNFAYSKAVTVYEKAVDLKQEENDLFDMQSALKIADSYRLMNKPVSAERWYDRVTEDELWTDEDKMNYAQVLLKNGKDVAAKGIISQIKSPGLADIERLKKVEDVEKYFTDSLAYLVKNLDINSEEGDFAPTYFEDGLVFVSNRPTKGLSQSTYYWDDTYFLDLYYTKNSEEAESLPEPMSKRINSIFHEGPAAFINNDNTIIFTRNNFNLGESKTSSDGVVKMKLFTSNRSATGRWEKPLELPFNSDEYTTSSPSFSEDEKTMYFHSDMPGGTGNSDIYKVSYTDGEWGAPVNLGDLINTKEDEMFPFISSEQILYFASTGHPGIGGLDIYKIDLNDPDAQVENMGYPINTAKDDFGLIIDDKTGYLSSNRDGGKGSDDIYGFKLYIHQLNVILLDEETLEPLTGLISAKALINEEINFEEENTNQLSFSTYRGKTFNLKGQSEGYYDNSFDFFSGNIPYEAESYTVEIPLKKIKLKGDIVIVKNYGHEDQILDIREETVAYDGTLEELKSEFETDYCDIDKLFELSAIYYDFDKCEIREDAAEGLDDLINVLENYQDLKVTLSGHTDIRGSRSYNERLSRDRVESAREYLLAKGIPEDRIVADYFGELNPVEDCGSCTEIAHQLNRRTEIYLS
ncbi:MAG: OmpA family protein [Cyclobacteriaceae bacterium]